MAYHRVQWHVISRQLYRTFDDLNALTSGIGEYLFIVTADNYLGPAYTLGCGECIADERPSVKEPEVLAGYAFRPASGRDYNERVACHH
jgi:hypothetical protein